MATQDVDFKVGDGLGTNDSGYPGPVEETAAASIKKYAAGERVRAVVFNRPLENLRKRTETLRTEVSAQKYLQDSDIKWIITGGDASAAVTGNSQPKVVWTPGTSKFTITNDIVIQPIAGPKTDKLGSITYSKNVSPNIWSITLSNSTRRYFGGHQTAVHWVEVDPSVLTPDRAKVEVTYDPYPTLVITICNDGTTLVGDIATELVGVGSGFAYSTSGAGIVNLADIKVDGSINPDYVFATTYEREFHRITPALLASFFATPETITSGDTLCISYEWLVNPDGFTLTGRRQATTSSGTATLSVPGQLFLADAHPDRLPLAIPICKRVGDDLIFIDGTIVRGDEAGDVYFGMNGYTTYAFRSTTAPSGATLIGVSARTHPSGHKSADPFDITAGTLQAVLESFQTFANDKTSADFAEDVTGKWLFTDTVYGYEPILSSITLLWRAGGIVSGRPADAQISWRTFSRYAVLSTTYSLSYITIQGGYLEDISGSLKIHTPTTGSGNVHVTIESSGVTSTHVSEQNIRGSRRIYNATANTQYDLFPATAAAWRTNSLSGDIWTADALHMWGTAFTFVSPLVTFDVDALEYYPISEVTTSGARIIIHPAPTLVAETTIPYSTEKKAFYNSVLEGFYVRPAELVSVGTPVYTAGHFNVDEIRMTPGRAIVAGKVITIPEARTLSNVVANYLIPGTPLPVTSSQTRWYGVWLRSDGVFKVGLPPTTNSTSSVPGSTLYMLEGTYVESGFSRYDYTLLDVVWSYQGNTAGNIRFAGVAHRGGNVCLFHQARYGSYTGTVTWEDYVSHMFEFTDIAHSSSDEMIYPRLLTTSYKEAGVGNSLKIPGIPTSLTSVALIGINVESYLWNENPIPSTAPHFVYEILHKSNADGEVGIPTLASNVLTASPYAPPNCVDPTNAATPYADAEYTYSEFDHNASVIWGFHDYPAAHTSIMNAKKDITTIVHPYISTDSTGGSVRVGYRYSLDVYSRARVKLRTLGFMWNRYNLGISG